MRLQSANKRVNPVSPTVSSLYGGSDQSRSIRLHKLINSCWAFISEENVNFGEKNGPQEDVFFLAFLWSREAYLGLGMGKHGDGRKIEGKERAGQKQGSVCPLTSLLEATLTMSLVILRSRAGSGNCRRGLILRLMTQIQNPGQTEKRC